ncbi:MAG: Bug family tripartite tricarboxylate transporter substrate binding protein [Chloroflexota bacterium]
MRKHVTWVAAIASSLALVACGSPAKTATAGAFPVRPLTIIVPQAAGSVSDVLARTLAQPLGKIVHQTVVVKDLPGGSDTVGVAALEGAPADGYTMLFPSQSMEYGLAQHLTPYGAKDMIFLARLVQYPMGIYILRNSPYKTLGDLVQDAKAHPGSVSFSAAGAVSAGQEIVAKLEAAEHIQVTYVSAKGGNQAAVAVLSGQSTAAAGVLGNALPYVKAGKMRIIYLASTSPNSFFPNIPTASTLHIDDAVANWVGVVVKAGTPPSVQQKLVSAIEQATKDKKWQAFSHAKALSPAWASTNAFQAAVAAEIPQVTAYVNASHK